MLVHIGLAAAILFVGTFAAHAQGDAEAGEQVFRRCQSCHDVGEGAQSKVGPILNGVVGAEWAHRNDYTYSDGMQEGAAGGKVWDEETLDAFLLNPREIVPGTKMVFPGLRNEEQRADVIAYLATFEEEAAE